MHSFFCCFSFSLGDWVGGWVDEWCVDGHERPEVDTEFCSLSAFIFQVSHGTWSSLID